LKRKVSSFNENRSNTGLTVNRGNNKERDGESKSKLISKSRSSRHQCFHCEENGHTKKDYPQQKKRNKIRESNSSTASATVV
jgi:hypothetical protein